MVILSCENAETGRRTPLMKWTHYTTASFSLIHQTKAAWALLTTASKSHRGNRKRRRLPPTRISCCRLFVFSFFSVSTWTDLPSECEVPLSFVDDSSLTFAQKAAKRAGLSSPTCLFVTQDSLHYKDSLFCHHQSFTLVQYVAIGHVSTRLICRGVRVKSWWNHWSASIWMYSSVREKCNRCWFLTPLIWTLLISNKLNSLYLARLISIFYFY